MQKQLCRLHLATVAEATAGYLGLEELRGTAVQGHSVANNADKCQYNTAVDSSPKTWPHRFFPTRGYQRLTTPRPHVTAFVLALCHISIKPHNWRSHRLLFGGRSKVLHCRVCTPDVTPNKQSHTWICLAPLCHRPGPMPQPFSTRAWRSGADVRPLANRAPTLEARLLRQRLTREPRLLPPETTSLPVASRNLLTEAPPAES